MGFFAGVGAATALGVTCYASYWFTHMLLDEKFASGNAAQWLSTGRKVMIVVASFLIGAIVGAMVAMPLFLVSMVYNAQQCAAIALIFSAATGGTTGACFWIRSKGLFSHATP